MLVKDWIQFGKDWNNGTDVKVLSERYQCSEATVRNWVNVLRKKGVALNKRNRGTNYNLSNDDINVINRGIK